MHVPDSMLCVAKSVTRGSWHPPPHAHVGVWEVILSRSVREQRKMRREGYDIAAEEEEEEDERGVSGEHAGLRAVLYALSSAMPGANFVMVAALLRADAFVACTRAARCDACLCLRVPLLDF